MSLVGEPAAKKVELVSCSAKQNGEIFVSAAVVNPIPSQSTFLNSAGSSNWIFASPQSTPVNRLQFANSVLLKVVEKSEPLNKPFIMVPFPSDKLSASPNANWTNSAIAVAIVVGICLVVLLLLLCVRCKKPSQENTDNWWEVLPPQYATVSSTQFGGRDSRSLGCDDPCGINCVPEPVSGEQVNDDEDEEPVFEMVDLPIKSKTTKV